LYGENNIFITSYPLGDTCGQAEIKVTYQPDAKFCEGAGSGVDETAVADDAGTNVIPAAAAPVPSAQVRTRNHGDVHDECGLTQVSLVLTALCI
jgi:hypothetical protein